MVSHGIELAIIESDAKIFVDALINPSLANTMENLSSNSRYYKAKLLRLRRK